MDPKLARLKAAVNKVAATTMSAELRELEADLLYHTENRVVWVPCAVFVDTADIRELWDAFTDYTKTA